MQVTIIGLDLAKPVFQVHGVDAAGKTSGRRKLQWPEVGEFFAGLPPCLSASRRALLGRLSEVRPGMMCPGSLVVVVVVRQAVYPSQQDRHGRSLSDLQGGRAAGHRSGHCEVAGWAVKPPPRSPGEASAY